LGFKSSGAHRVKSLKINIVPKVYGPAYINHGLGRTSAIHFFETNLEAARGLRNELSSNWTKRGSKGVDA
jgi:hypothetical protein